MLPKVNLILIRLIKRRKEKKKEKCGKSSVKFILMNFNEIYFII